MPRQRKCRMINETPNVTYFKPKGVPMRDLAEVYLPLDGFEAIRLADLNELSHEEAAQQMNISRQTFGRILSSARYAVAKAIVGGLALKIIRGGEHNRPGENEKQPGFTPSKAGAMMIQNRPEPGHADTKENLTMKKIAVTSDGPTLDDLVDPRFGRAAGFIVVDPETLEFSYVENGAAQARSRGAGIQAAETLANTGAGAVLTGYVGPKAFAALSAAGIKIAQNLENMTVREAVGQYNKGQVSWAEPSEAKGMGK
ncbi:MAG: DUF134 domain-containing protein [Proteobacteria bacterium]|nr:DUF134 domain-containing protein [Pseudomonadota bacterium]